MNQTVVQRAVSPSAILTLSECERKYAYEHGLDSKIQPHAPHVSATAGTVMHAAIAAYYKGDDPLLAVGAAIEECRALGEDVSLAEELSYELFRFWLTEWQAKHKWKPTALEEECVFEWAGYPVRGVIDARDDALIVDWKSARLPWSAKKDKVFDSWLQRTAYSAATGIRKTLMVVVSYEVSVGRYDSRPEFSVEEYAHTVSDRDLNHFSALVRAWGPRVQSVDIEDFAPMAKKHWLCSQKWCSYYSVCPGGGR